MCTNPTAYNAKDIEQVLAVFLEDWKVLFCSVLSLQSVGRKLAACRLLKYKIQRICQEQYNKNVAYHLLRFEICSLCDWFAFKTPWSLSKSDFITSNKKNLDTWTQQQITGQIFKRMLKGPCNFFPATTNVLSSVLCSHEVIDNFPNMFLSWLAKLT